MKQSITVKGVGKEVVADEVVAAVELGSCSVVEERFIEELPRSVTYDHNL